LLYADPSLFVQIGLVRHALSHPPSPKALPKTTVPGKGCGELQKHMKIYIYPPISAHMRYLEDGSGDLGRLR
jgi:hypothetical protein